ncbi:hypothetical protein FACS1894109_13810 [Spirochaetia bacterium]|nr:hypothetical protein FACS1894109_13810 [Spirochaetia bacterium]
MSYVFEWDENKNVTNIRKHGIAFEDAKYVFQDPFYMVQFDWEHSIHEERWKVYGFIDNVLVVIFTEKDTVIRIISARKASPAEQEEYYYGYSTYDFE